MFFVSGIYFKGPPFQILKAWNDGRIQLALSAEILDEYRRVGEILSQDHPNIDLQPMLDYVIQNAEMFTAPPLPEPVCDDPEDDKFLACALSSGSAVIVSGDRHLLNVTGYQKIRVLKPRDFINEFLS